MTFIRTNNNKEIVYAYQGVDKELETDTLVDDSSNFSKLQVKNDVITIALFDGKLPLYLYDGEVKEKL